MHFKSAVILCTIYFITSIRSAGLNREQIQICINMYENRDPETYLHEIPHVMEHQFGINNPERIFKRENEFHYIIFKKAFLALAYEDEKTFDSFAVPMLTSFEVEYYLNKFIEHLERYGQHRYLLKDQLLVLFVELHLTEEEKAKAESYIETKEMFHEADFLLIMLEILPEGNGLSEAQIEEFIRLYRFQCFDTYRIDPLKIQNILNQFNMVLEPLDESILLNSRRRFAKELMELMIVTAERSRTLNENDEIVLSTNEVRSLISEFAELDRDKDGRLTENESNKFVREFIAKNPPVPTFHFDYKEIHVAKYLLFQIHAKKLNNHKNE